ncbi:Hypothetical predicted protein [Mytilus galloprovincialis]|uniref:Uncharacterized protein n=1 Tax=Mytilus galloprovincialis TaxID=29158 RepID=A0A8B6FUK3_MYTGA|nr:Hypothetical predicted protein [Mytilus galloprovincialis]
MCKTTEKSTFGSQRQISNIVFSIRDILNRNDKEIIVSTSAKRCMVNKITGASSASEIDLLRNGFQPGTE